MPDAQSQEIYQNIRLTRDLRPEILARYEERKSPHPPVWMRPAAALCSLAIVVGAALLLLRSPTAPIYMNGDSVGGRAQTALTESVDYTGGVMRLMADPGEETPPLQTAEGCIPLTVKFGQDVFISVSGGILLLPDAQSIPTFAGQSGMAADNSVIYWSPVGCESTSPLYAYVTDGDNNALATLTLTYDSQNALWRIQAE